MLKLTFALLISITVAQLCCGQEKPQAELMDDFRDQNCDWLSGRINSFFATLQDEPESSGQVIIYSRNQYEKWPLLYANILEAYTNYLKFDRSRFSVIRVEKDVDQEIQFWKIPPGAEYPVIEGTQWSRTISSEVKPFIFAYDDDFSFCYTYSPANYLEFLSANPNANANIVVFEHSRTKGRVKSNHLIKVLTADGRIKRNRFRIFYKKSEKSRTGAEFWIVPSRKSRAPKML